MRQTLPQVFNGTPREAYRRMAYTVNGLASDAGITVNVPADTGAFNRDARRLILAVNRLLDTYGRTPLPRIIADGDEFYRRTVKEINWLIAQT